MELGSQVTQDLEFKYSLGCKSIKTTSTYLIFSFSGPGIPTEDLLFLLGFLWACGFREVGKFPTL